MPKTTKSGGAKQDELPSTLQRSDDKAQRTYAKAHDSAAEQYGDEERANRVAFSALKHTHESRRSLGAEAGEGTVRRPGRGWLRHRPADGRWGRRERIEKAPLRARHPARCRGSFVDDQGRAGGG